MIAQAVNLARLLRDERRSRKIIWQIQNTAFLALFRYAYKNVPFYRELYLTHHIAIDEIRSLKDIQKLPVIRKKQLQDAAASGKLWADTQDCYRVETSGSSGAPLCFYVNRKDNRWRKAQYLLPYVSTGRTPWDSVLHLKGQLSSYSPWFRMLGLFKEKQMYSDSPVKDHYSALIGLKPDHLQGYPSALRLLALHVLSNRLACPPLKKVYTDSEMLFPKTRALLQRAFGADVIDVYGSYETDNIAYECSLHDGYHILEDSVFVETVSGVHSESSEGSGELVCTVLHNTKTPFIRYNLGDTVEIESGLCGCGRKSMKLSVLAGRTTDLVRLANGSCCTPDFLIRHCNDMIFDMVREFQIRQVNEHQIEVLLVPNKNLNLGDFTEFKSVFSKSVPSATTIIRIVNKIERTAAGKHKAFIKLDSYPPDNQ